MKIFRGKTLRLCLAAIPLLALLLIALLFLSRYVIDQKSTPFLYKKLSDLPKSRVTLVLGCSPKIASGHRNLYFEYRMNAALELWKAKKTDFILVSGDNRQPGYDEPTEMMNALVRRGIPERAIVRDFAGIRTLDSVLRAHQVFGEDHFCIVSQEDHLRRAIYLARGNGLNVVGYIAKEVPFEKRQKTAIRETFARLQALIDINLLHRQSRTLGKKIQIGNPITETPSDH